MGAIGSTIQSRNENVIEALLQTKSATKNMIIIVPEAILIEDPSSHRPIVSVTSRDVKEPEIAARDDKGTVRPDAPYAVDLTA